MVSVDVKHHVYFLHKRSSSDMKGQGNRDSER